MLSLPSVTLVAVSSVNLRRTISALRFSMKEIQFADVKLLTHEIPKRLDPRINTHLVSKIDSIDKYSEFMVYKLGDYIDTEHCLIVQADGFVLHADKWSNDFLKYDYIGAPWPVTKNAYIDPFGNHVRVGNGGFSLRSQKLLSVPKDNRVVWDVNSSDFYAHMNVGLQSEDGIICVHNRHVYEQAGCVFAPIEIAAKFATEVKVAESSRGNTFGYHKRRPPFGWVLQANRFNGYLKNRYFGR